MNYTMYILIYLVVINILTFLIYYLDKQKAIKQKYRISETTLLKLALIGGSVGAVYGMKHFKHKTNKASFFTRVYLIMSVQLFLVMFLFYYTLKG